jgi:hypothetical protein
MKHITNDFGDVWKEACRHYHGEILTGNFCHFCRAVGRMPIDETCGKLWEQCKCYTRQEIDQGYPNPISTLEDIQKLTEELNDKMVKKIFVFGSNLAGRHGKGAALCAREKWGAEYGVGEGRTGDSYALPTKDVRLKSRSLEDIKESVNTFIEYANLNPDLVFIVTKIGCGLAGFTEQEIAPMFKFAPQNCELPEGWR